MGIINKHLMEAINLFEEVEDDILLSDQQELHDEFEALREQTVYTNQMLGDRISGQAHNIPPVQYGPQKASRTDLSYKIPVGSSFVPMFRHDVAPSALPQKVFPGFHPDEDSEVFSQDFVLPVEIFLDIPSREARHVPVQPQPQPQPQTVFQPPTPVTLYSSRSTGQSAPSSTVTAPSVPSLPVSFPMPRPLPPPVTASTSSSSVAATSKGSSTSSSRSTYVKKFNCKFCKYSTDRKNDWDNHCNRHTGTRYECSHPGCKKTFSSEKNRTFHCKNVHLTINRATCSVSNCNFQCNDYGKFR
ncbi:MAG: hypothetical protein MJE68_28200, partial [Proteobacteria bacterium]|nr:hypothetical protein [Pseudomonadota bacterium]